MLYKRKLGMWKRINRDETNEIIKECKREQINSFLPWCKEIVRIASELGIDLEKAKIYSKEKWKEEVNKRIKDKVKRELEEGREDLKRYTNNAKDEITPEKSKRYMRYSQKNAKVWCRMRLDLIDPSPRSPFDPRSIWRCKFCDTSDQSVEHYIVHCSGVDEKVFKGNDRKKLFELIQTLDGDNEDFAKASTIFAKLYELVVRE